MEVANHECKHDFSRKKWHDILFLNHQSPPWKWKICICLELGRDVKKCHALWIITCLGICEHRSLLMKQNLL